MSATAITIPSIEVSDYFNFLNQLKQAQPLLKGVLPKSFWVTHQTLSAALSSSTDASQLASIVTDSLVIDTDAIPDVQVAPNTSIIKAPRI